MKSILLWGLAGLVYILLFTPYIPKGGDIAFGTIAAMACAGGVYITWRPKR